MKRKEESFSNKLNHQVENNTIRVIKSDELDGVYPKSKAIGLAISENKDLIELSSNNDVSICRIMEFSKFCYEQKKIDKENAKKNKRSEQKELRFTPNIGENDLNTKIKKAFEFIDEGNEVKICVMFSGREMNYKDHGKVVIAKIMHALQDKAKMKSDVAMNGKLMTVVLCPR